MLQDEILRIKEQLNSRASSIEKKLSSNNWTLLNNGGGCSVAASASSSVNAGQLSPPTSQKSGALGPSLVVASGQTSVSQLRKFGVNSSGLSKDAVSGTGANGSLSQQHHILSGIEIVFFLIYIFLR